MSRLIETIRVEGGKIENLELHLKRMRGSLQAVFGKMPDWDVKDAFHLTDPQPGTFKYRIVYDASGFESTITPYTIRPLRSLKLVFANGIVYDHKFEDRSELEGLSAQRENCDDILIIKNNVVTDISYANIIFRKGNQWYTPDSFLLNGIMRQRLLSQGSIIERRIPVDDIREFTHFRPVNAMLGVDAPESEVSNIR